MRGDAAAAKPSDRLTAASPVQERVAGADGYPLEVRVWRAAVPIATVVVLHGIVSHAGWLDPIASLLCERGADVICPDRRGSGRNSVARGDAPSGDALLEDLDRVIESCAQPGLPTHLCGFCWGAVYALRYLSTPRPAIQSLLLLAPGLYPADELARLPLRTGNSSEPTEEPLVPLDGFTRGPALREFILPDPLRLARVSPRFNGIVEEFSQLITPRLARVRIPVLCVLAAHDRISDNDATRRALERMRGTVPEIHTVAGEHGVQFDAPAEAAELMYRWIDTHRRRPAA
jgi:acylglycerol lipase